MTPRRCLVTVALALALTAPSTPRAAQPATGGEAIQALEDRLTAGLRVRTPAEVAFCERVVAAVRAGRIPAPVVDATYLWAVRRGKKYPFPAFQHALRIKAAKLGVTL